MLKNNDPKFSKFCLLFAIFISSLSSGLTFAKWVEIGRNLQEGIVVSFEAESIRHNGRQTQVKVLYNFTKPNTDMNILHSSEVEWVTFDCQKQTLRLDDVQWFKGQSAKGAVVWQTKNLEWQTLERGSSYERLFGQVCRK
jgi:hypothetical protein